jgi:hypothetical protein
MSWLKKSDDFAIDCRDLSDAAYRTHDEGLLWAMHRLNRGRFAKRELYRFAETMDPDKAAAELVEAGLWKDLGDSYEIVHCMPDQEEPDVLTKRRADTAERTRKWRRKAAGLPEEDGAA